MSKPRNPWTPRRLREALGFGIRDWSRVLGVSERTIQRWEEEGVEPAGLAGALDAGAVPVEIHQQIAAGVGAYLRQGLTRGKHHR